MAVDEKQFVHSLQRYELFWNIVPFVRTDNVYLHIYQIFPILQDQNRITMNILEEAARCLFCADAPCSKACKNGDPARAIRSVRFGNQALARQWVKDCSEEELVAAEKACIHYDFPIRIRELVKALPEVPYGPLPSLAIDFCGIRC
jgi:hypothetical protein